MSPLPAAEDKVPIHAASVFAEEDAPVAHFVLGSLLRKSPAFGAPMFRERERKVYVRQLAPVPDLLGVLRIGSLAKANQTITGRALAAVSHVAQETSILLRQSDRVPGLQGSNLRH